MNVVETHLYSTLLISFVDQEEKGEIESFPTPSKKKLTRTNEMELLRMGRKNTKKVVWGAENQSNAKLEFFFPRWNCGGSFSNFSKNPRFDSNL